MGGSGTWLVASHHPELFAAAAPVYGGWDYRIIPGFGFDNATASRPGELFAKESQSSFAGAEGLLNVPLLVTHGDNDQVVTVEFSRHAVKMLQRWNYDIRYNEIPGRGHEDLEAQQQISAWLLTHRRNNAPREVRLRATSLVNASAHWVRVEAWIAPLQVVRADAQVVGPALVRLDTENVASVALSPPRELIGAGKILRVVWNGEERSIPIDANGSAWANLPNRPIRGKAANGALTKHPALEGGLSRFFTTPFVVVVGTSSTDSEMRRICQQKADSFAQFWDEWQHVTPRILRDDQVTPEIERKFSLLLIGGADANRVSRRMAFRLPLTVTRNSVTVQDRKFAVADAAAQMIYPNPSQPERYVLLVAGTSAAGLYFWNVAGYIHPIFRFPTLEMDWIINDGRRVTLENGLGAERAWVASGVFDINWRRDDRWTFLGDDKLRAQSPLRHSPGSRFTVPVETLDSYVGVYELQPGLNAIVTRKDQTLVVEVGGGPPLQLIAETDREFSMPTFDGFVFFERDASGKVSQFTSTVDRETHIGKKVR